MTDARRQMANDQGQMKVAFPGPLPPALKYDMVFLPAFDALSASPSENMLDEAAIQRHGKALFDLIADDKPSVFDRSAWAARLLDLAMRHAGLKTQLFRYLDVFPSLSTGELIISHLREYFLDPEVPLPRMFRPLVAAASHPVAAPVTAAVIRRDVRAFSRTLILGESPKEAEPALRDLRDSGRGFTVDILGEAAVSEVEASRYQALYMAFAEKLAAALPGWSSPPAASGGEFPDLNLSVKLSSLYSQIRPQNHDDSVTRLQNRLRPIFRSVMQRGGGVNLDMERFELKEITLDVFTGLLGESEFRGWEGAGIAIQAYLRDALDDLERLGRFARETNRRVTIRLIKGAYWEYENVVASRNRWRLPVWTRKTHTDWNFERCIERILEYGDVLRLAAGTHNVRSVAAVLAAMERASVSPDRFEFQMLYGMAEPVKNALARQGHAVREYTPVGKLLPGMAYLVRRLLENTSNEGFLRRRFAEGAPVDELLAAPEPPPVKGPAAEADAELRMETAGFANDPPTDFAVSENRRRMDAALAEVRASFPYETGPCVARSETVDGREIRSTNPANPGEIVGLVQGASPEQLERALRGARAAQTGWAAAGYEKRAAILEKAASITRDRRFELMAWQVFEAGKSRMEADGDVVEAIDFMRFYASEARRLGPPRKLGDRLGEENRLYRRPRGVGVVIAPWNFPLAISAGMVTAALVTGNTVVYKPSSLTPVNGRLLVSILHEAGVPEGVLHYLPGSGSRLGSALATHPETDFVAFTGSREVGLGLIRSCSDPVPGQRQIRRVIAEMGGKNAVIVDADADLDLAVTGVIASAFGYQGQKCSACSRVVVVKEGYDRFLERLTEAVNSIPVGPPEDPASFMGPVIDAEAKRKINRYIALGEAEGRTLVQGGGFEGAGHYVPPVVFVEIPTTSALWREEIFGPVLVVTRAGNFEEALLMAADTDYALTGGLFSRSPAHIRRALEAFPVGNLYINRGVTGAIVGRQPFGGHRMSGTGPKAGGRDALGAFLQTVVVSENTMRRGFAPDLDS